MTKWTIFTGLIIAEVLFGIIIPYWLGSGLGYYQSDGILLMVEKWSTGAFGTVAILVLLWGVWFIITSTVKATRVIAEELTNKNTSICEEVEYEGYR